MISSEACSKPCTRVPEALLCLQYTGPTRLPGAQDVDKVELIYTKFVSLIASEPTIQTLLPLTPQVRSCRLAHSRISGSA